jgi:hypothetical protein
MYAYLDDLTSDKHAVQAVGTGLSVVDHYWLDCALASCLLGGCDKHNLVAGTSTQCDR